MEERTPGPSQKTQKRRPRAEERTASDDPAKLTADQFDEGKEPDSKTEEAQPWPQFIAGAPEGEIQERVGKELRTIAEQFKAEIANYCVVGLYDPDGTISSWEADRIYTALQTENAKKDKDVLLFLHSRGGQIEPAYQISKVCKAYAKKSFVVTVPRMAKSAATLIALGADRIHMGLLGQLGPIDPQLGNLPALGVKRALETIAGLCQQFPGSSQAFAAYMKDSVTIEQIGYCERVSESAAQYAERLLAKKAELAAQAGRIARELVYEYKDHGFVIDIEEAREHLGKSWILTDTGEIRFAERVSQFLEYINLMLWGIRKNKRLLVVGGLYNGALIFNTK